MDKSTDNSATAVHLILSSFGELTDANYPYMRHVVYLVQAMGVDLLVSYGWYHRRSGVSTQKLYGYYLEARRLDKLVVGVTLRSDVVEKVTKLQALLQAKPEFLTVESWANVLVNYHFLRTVSKLSKDDALPYIEVGHYNVDAAEAALKEYGLL